MGTPQQLLDAEAEADRLIADMNKGGGEGTPPSDEAGDQPKPDDQAGETPTDSPEETPVAEEKPTKDVETDDSLKAQLAELKAQFDKLQAQHDTLRGKTYAEVPRVIAENKTLRDRITELEGQLAQKETVQTPVKVGAKAAEILAKLKENTDEEVADSIQSLVNAIVEEQVSARVAPVEGRIEGLRKSAIELAEEKYIKELTAAVPDWEQIAPKPEYREYLSQTDKYSGRSLYDLASDALSKLDASRMANFFNGFKEANGMVAPPASAAKPKSDDRPSGKEALVAPRSTSKTDAREGGASGKPDLITTKQLEEWSRKEYRAGLTREQEAALEARIDRAIQNRWVIPP